MGLGTIDFRWRSE